MNAFEAAQPFLQASAKENGDAAVVFVGSITSSESAVGGSYGAMKAAVSHLSKSLAIAHAKDRIRVNVVSPGMVDFEGSVWKKMKLHDPSLYDRVRQSVRLGQPARPEHIADTIAFLWSPVPVLRRGQYSNGWRSIKSCFILSVNFKVLQCAISN